MRTSPHDPPQVPLTPEQSREHEIIARAHMQAGAQWQDKFSEAMGQKELRKWCIEQAIKFCEQSTEPCNLRDVATDIIEFIGEPFGDMLQKERPAE